MKIIIVGVGKVGLAIAREMEGEQHDLTLVDVSDEVLDLVKDSKLPFLPYEEGDNAHIVNRCMDFYHSL